MHPQDVSMTSPLALPDQAAAPVIWITVKQSSTNVVDILFASGTDGSIEHQHGSCRMTIAHKPSRISDWSRMQRLVYDRTKALRVSSSGHRMTTLPFYALFAQVVTYQDSYKTMEEVCVAEDFDDAVAVMRLPLKSDADELDIHSPYVLDAFVHLAGFLLNTRSGKDEDDLYIAHHIGNVDITEVMTTQIDGKRTKIYTSVRESSVAGERVCDAYVFDDDSKALMVSCSDIRFKKIDRAAFYSLTMQSNSNHFSYAPKPKPLPQLEINSPVSNKGLETPPRLSTSNAETLLKCIASELGMDTDDLALNKTFDSLGLDSLKSIRLLGTFARKTGIQLPAAFFAHHSTVAAARAAIDDAPNAVLSQQTTNSSDTSSRNETPLALSSTSRQDSTLERLVSQSNLSTQGVESRQSNPHGSRQVVPEPRVVLIQGSSDSRAAPLFLAAAGVGLIAPYIHFPPFPDDRRAYALESPFLNCPELYNGTVEEMAINWIPAIRKIQPHGPYLLGGYSAGAVFAYEIARRLTAEYDERIVGLVLIDMRVPRRCPKIEQVLVSTLLNTGMLDGLGDMTPSNKLHSAQTSRAVAGYEPIPFEQGKQPALSHVIWAGRGFAETTPSAMYPVGHGKPYPPSEMDLEAYIAEFRRCLLVNGKILGRMDGRRTSGITILVSQWYNKPPLVKELGEILVRVLGEVEELV
ncbi:hypothetical protein PRZ48_010684 [Zasmidium cellare]|uniref:Carrier domain-containing protein n=1 Tax=Zasmidium cellare TaxID=395010 RepID=A0ABR0EA95_ZASCE|nr:hypothetical protein PRZ48_010684 [Zasmidium cellare]